MVENKTSSNVCLEKMKRRNFLYIFFLPFVWLNILFGNQLAYPNIAALGQVFYWLMILNVALIFLMEGSDKRSLMFLFYFGMFFFRFLALIIEQVYPMYLLFVATVFAFAGFLFFKNSANLFKRQIVLFVVFSIPIMFLQVAGWSETLHYFNTLYVREILPGVHVMKEKTMLNLLFNYSTIHELAYIDRAYILDIGWQSRPPGLLHSNAMLVPVILGAVVFQLSELAGRRQNVTDYLVFFAVVLTGSKMALYGTVLLLMATYHYLPQHKRRRVLKLFLALGMCLLLHYFTFPVCFMHSHSMDSLAVSFGVRIYDLLLYVKDYIPLSDILQMFSFLSEAAERKENAGIEGVQGMSGIIYIVYALPFMLVMWIFVGRLYWRKLKRFDKANAEKSLLIRLSLPWIFLVLMATPLAGAPFHSIFVGVALAPLLMSQRDFWKFYEEQNRRRLRVNARSI